MRNGRVPCIDGEVRLEEGPKESRLQLATSKRLDGVDNAVIRAQNSGQNHASTNPSSSYESAFSCNTISGDQAFADDRCEFLHSNGNSISQGFGTLDDFGDLFVDLLSP